MRRSLAAILLALAASCSPSTGGFRSEVPLPPTFSLPGAEDLPDRWWTALPDPDLHALVDRALAGSLTLRAAWARLAQADASVRGARAASRPTLTASADGGGSVGGDASGAIDPGASASAGLAASYEIDLWGRIRAEKDAATLSAAATEHDVHAAAISLTAELALSWYDLVLARAEDDLAARQLAASEQTLALVQRRVSAGLAASDDEIRQLQAVESLRSERALTVGRIAVLEHRIAVLAGAPPTTRVAPAGATLVDLPPLPATGVPAEILQRRPDVLAAFTRIRVADRDVAAAIADRYPRVTLSARAGAGLPFTGWLASLAAGLTAPLLDGGRRAAEVDRARAGLAERVLGYQQLVLEAATEVEDALVLERQQDEYLEGLDRQLALSERAVEAARRRYAAGLGDYLEVLDAEESHHGVERRRLAARADRIAIRIGLYRALAGSWGLAPAT